MSFTHTGLNKLQAIVSDLVMYGIAKITQAAFMAYTSFLPAFISATSKSTRVRVDPSYHPISWDNSKTFPYTYPNLSVAFRQQPSSTILDQLKAHGYEEQSIKGRKVFLFENPTIELVRIIMATDHDSVCPAPNSFVNTSCLRSIALVRRIFSGFFHTHTYPAFATPEHAHEISELRKLSDGAQKRSREDENTGSRKRTTQGLRAELEEGEEPEMDVDPVPSVAPIVDRFIKYAHPTSPTTLPWGSIQDTPNTHGLFVPFIPELLGIDTRFVVNTVIRWFAGCLGSDINQVRRTQEMLSSAFGIVAYTLVGKVLLHMSLCITLALTSQARVFPIFENERYEGCVLSGALFSVVVGKNTYSPVPYDTLMEELSKFGGTAANIRSIAVLAGLTDPTYMAGTVKLTHLGTLKKVLRDAALTNSQRDEIVKICHSVNFRTTWALNPATLHRALDLLATCQTVQDLPEDDLPIHPTMLFEDDVLSVVWSCFGDMAPSTYFNAPSHDLASNKVPTHIGFTLRIMSQAISEMRQVFADKKITIPSLNRRSTVHKDRIFTGSTATSLLADIRRAASVTVAISGSAVVSVPASGEVDLFDAF